MIITRDLGKQSGDFGLKREVSVRNEKSSYTPKIDRSKKILQVQIQNIPSSAVLRCVGNNGAIAFESMRESILETSRLINFLRTVLQEVREIPLQLFQIVGRRIDCAGTTLGFPNLEGVIFILFYVQYVGER